MEEKLFDHNSRIYTMYQNEMIPIRVINIFDRGDFSLLITYTPRRMKVIPIIKSGNKNFNSANDIYIEFRLSVFGFIRYQIHIL